MSHDVLRQVTHYFTVWNQRGDISCKTGDIHMKVWNVFDSIVLMLVFTDVLEVTKISSFDIKQYKI